MSGSPSPDPNLRVLALTRYDRVGASSRMRHLAWVPFLRGRRISVNAQPLLYPGYVEALYAGQPKRLGALAASYGRRMAKTIQARDYDLLWIEKELLPYFPAWIEHALIGGRAYVLDFDDFWAERYARPPASFVAGKKFSSLIARASAVCVGSTFLAQWAASAGAQKIVQIPTCVDVQRYPLAEQNGTEPLRIGWIGTQSTIGYLAALGDVLAKLSRDKNMKLVVIGVPGFTLPAVDVESLSWSEVEEGRLLASCHVGIMPLSDGDWERGKCAYKLVQYMAAGLPVIGSAVGENNSILVPGESGFLVRSDQEWVAALNQLAEEPELRSKMGVFNRRRVEDRYSFTANLDAMAQMLRSAAQS